MASYKFSEDDIIPKKLACKYDPPTLAFEYHLKDQNLDKLLKINLEECFKNYDDPNDICKWIFNNYGDIINTRTISVKQVLNLIQRILLMRRMGSNKANSSSDNSLVKEGGLFEPEPFRNEEEKEFYKSNQNFYKQSDNSDNEEISVSKSENIRNPNSINTVFKNKNSALEERNQLYSDDFIKQEISESNRINRYVTNPYEEEDDEQTEKNELDLISKDNEIQINNLSEYFTKNKSIENNSDNFADEISIESLNSDNDDKF